MIRTRRGRTGRRGRQRTGQRLHPSTAKPRRSEEPVETVLTTGAEADRADSGTGPLPSTEEQRAADVPGGTATSPGTGAGKAELDEGLHPPTNEERQPTDETQGTATERSTGTDVEAKAGWRLNPFKRRRRGKRRPKPPKPLDRYFPIARVNEETVGLLGGVEVSVMEVRGVEAEQPLVAAFAGVLNALDFTVQLLVRQHPPRLQSLREAIAGQRPDDLAAGVAAASDSLENFLVRLEGQTGVVDRRFYAVCERSRADELHGLISRAGFSVFPLRGHALRSLAQAALAGCAPPVPDEEVLQRVGGLRRLIEVMVGERLSPEQRATLDQALTAYYTGARTVTGFHDFFAFLEAEGYGGMASLLRPFSTGSLRHLLTDEGADLLGRELPITVFNLRLLEPELRPAATLVCAEAVWGMASRDPRPRVLVVDEVWSIMQHPEGASFLVSLAKRARKHKLGLISITQDVQDFLGEDTSRAIVGHSGRVLLQNSAFKLLLQQDAAALAAVAESFDLSASDVQWLLSAPRGDGMLIARGGRFPVRVLATPEEHRLIDAVGGKVNEETTETEQAGTSNSQQ